MGGFTDRPHEGLLDWRVAQQQLMPLSVAAAIAFYQAQRGTKSINTPSDYMDALDIAAAALSRLIPIYAMDERLRTRVIVDIDFLRGEFAAGASEYRCRDGSTLKALSVVRGDLASALSFMKQVGPALAFAFAGAATEPAAAPERAPESSRP